MVDPEAGQSATPGWGELLVVNGGDGRVALEWDSAVRAAARQAGNVLDANGYLAPTSVLNTATEDE
jgi:hypothetical protein